MIRELYKLSLIQVKKGVGIKEASERVINNYMQNQKYRARTILKKELT